MAKTEVILTSNLVGLGAESDQVKVAAGYARNYLFPHALAIPVSAANKRRLESLRQRRAEREAHELNSMNELASSISKILLKITVKTGADGKMFGAVTAGTIADELKHQCDVTLDRRKIHLELPIRSIGDHEVELRLHADVKCTLKVQVEASAPAEIPLADAKTGAPQPDSRENRDGRPQRPSRDRRPAAEPAAATPSPARDSRPSKGRPAKPAA
jgi:large subunit ribosomal protein L9